MLNDTCKQSAVIFSVGYSLKCLNLYSNVEKTSTTFFSNFCKSLRIAVVVNDFNLFRYSSLISSQQKFHFNEISIPSLRICKYWGSIK
ncbi:hypothetical protein FPL18_01990 [Acinetobacter gyllenbergii]|nr:hypothetical protein FPL18_01990 [Acinetobacter gyllenbergii]